MGVLLGKMELKGWPSRGDDLEVAQEAQLSALRGPTGRTGWGQAVWWESPPTPIQAAVTWLQHLALPSGPGSQVGAGQHRLHTLLQIPRLWETPPGKITG